LQAICPENGSLRHARSDSFASTIIEVRAADYRRLRGLTFIAVIADEVDLLASSRRVDLVDNPKLISQLCALERRTARSGRDSVDHPPGGNDDLANAVAGVATALAADRGAAYREFCRRFNGGTDADPDGVEAWRRLRDFAYVSSGGVVKLW
jgi:hypothetical protein